jgi:hypothetical protein
MGASREKKERQELRRQGTVVDPEVKRKRQRKAESASLANRILAIVVSVLLAMGVIAFVLNIAAVPHRVLTALTVGGIRVTAAEYNVYFGDIYSSTMQMYEYYGIDTTQMGLDEEYFRQQTESQIQSTVLLAAEARKNNMELTEANRAALEESLKGIDDSAKAEKISVNRLLSDAYGLGVTRAVYAKAAEDRALASQWSEEKPKTYGYAQSDLDSYYEENTLSVDLYTFRSFAVAAEATDEEASEEEQQAALDDAKKKADQFLAEITTEESFNGLAETYAAEDQKSTYTDDPDATLSDGVSISSYSEVETNWLSDAARKTGDKTVLDNSASTGYVVYYFLKRERPEAGTVDVRHILALFKDDTGAETQTPTDEQKETARVQAQAVLDEWNAGAKTEDSFAELAREKSEDNAEEGGLYEGLGPHTNFVAPFLDWCVDPVRKPGDTGLVETEYGYHVMYFVRATEDQEWMVTVRETLRSEDFSAYKEALNQANPVVKNEFGLSFTLKFKNASSAA